MTQLAYTHKAATRIGLGIQNFISRLEKTRLISCNQNSAESCAEKNILVFRMLLLGYVSLMYTTTYNNIWFLEVLYQAMPVVAFT